MEGFGEVELVCCKNKVGTAGLDVLRYSVKADETYVELVREAWEQHGRGVAKKLLKGRPVSDRVYCIRLDFVGVSVPYPEYVDGEFKDTVEWEAKNEVIVQGDVLDDWVRKNIVEGMAWWN